MKIRKQILFKDGYNYSGDLEEPNICPQCKYALKPVELGIFPFCDEKSQWFISVFYLCNHCYRTFVTLHKSSFSTHSHSFSATLLYTEPNRFVEESFDPKIVDLSPQFVKIYNQALAAECAGLDEIAGLGYRKALEFLTKDFCIHKNPGHEDEIKALPLGKCIGKYVDVQDIKTLATRSVWIGNDEAHYIRKQEGRDVTDMKTFIKALTYFVGMSLTVEDAASIDPA